MARNTVELTEEELIDRQIRKKWSWIGNTYYYEEVNTADNKTGTHMDEKEEAENTRQSEVHGNRDNKSWM